MVGSKINGTGEEEEEGGESMVPTRINFAESAAVSPKSRLTFERWDVRLRMDAVKRMALSLFLSLRGIVIYDVGVVGRDTVYLPTYLSLRNS